MNETTTPAVPAALLVPLPSDRLVTPQTIVAFMAMLIVLVIVCKTLWSGSDSAQSQILILASSTMAALLGYYFGSSKGSQDKDAKPSAPTTTTVVEPAKATTTTAPTPIVQPGAVA